MSASQTLGRLHEKIEAEQEHVIDTEVYFDGRPSILLLIPFFIKASIPAVITFIVASFIDWKPILADKFGFIDQARENGLSTQPVLVIVTLVLGTLSVAMVLYGFVMWLSTRYQITSDRIEYERGILSKTVLNVELWRVRDIFYRRSIIQFFLGLGVIDILATDDTIPRLKIGPIRGARGIYDEVKQARLKSGRLAGAQAMGMSTS